MSTCPSVTESTARHSNVPSHEQLASSWDTGFQQTHCTKSVWALPLNLTKHTPIATTVNTVHWSRTWLSCSSALYWRRCASCCIIGQNKMMMNVHTSRCDTRCCFNLHSKAADMSQLNLPHFSVTQKQSTFCSISKYKCVTGPQVFVKVHNNSKFLKATKFLKLLFNISIK